MKRLLILLAVIALAVVSCKNKEPKDYKGIVLIQTEYGDIKLRLYDETPLHKENFIKLADKGYYDGTLFHRVIDGFMIQGGDPDSKKAKAGKMLGEGGPGYQLKAEIKSNLFHKKGVIAAAREGDKVNPKRKSAGSQFYLTQGRVYEEDEIKDLADKINTRRRSMIFEKLKGEKSAVLERLQQKGDMIKLQEEVSKLNEDVDKLFEQDKLVLSKEQIDAYTTIGGVPHLDGLYTVFGEVIEGLDVIDKIAAVKTDNNDRPLEDIKMKVKVLE